MSDGSVAVLYDIDGDPMAVENGTAIPAATSSIISAGSDGTNARFVKVDSSGNQIMIGLGTAGTQTGGVLTIQGDPAGTPIPITGSISATNPSVGSNNTTLPTSSTLIGGSDGTDLRSLRVFDLDSGGGQQWVLGVGLRKIAGGGSVEFGTSSDPIRTDPTGSTAQPVSGTVAATQSGTWTVQPGNTANTTPWLTTINQGGNTATVSAAGALKIDGSAVTQPISGTVTVTQGTAANLRAQTSSESNTGSAIPTQASMTGGSDGTNLRAIFLDSSGRQIIIGAAANGAAVTGNPVLIAGSDGTNARSIRTATDGTVRVDPTGTTTQPVSGTVTSNQGTANTLANRWPVIVTDGTNTQPTGDTIARSIFHQISDGTTGPVAVKAASTAPVGTDKALVVVISPNQAAIPVTTSGGTNAQISYGDVLLNSITTAFVARTTYTEPAANFQGSIVSSSANDTSAGTGARTVRIYWMNSTGTSEGTEDVTLNGVTNVNLVTTTKCYIEKMEVLTVGSTGSNVGTITLRTGLAGGGNIVGTIAATNNKTFWAHHYVLSGKICNINGIIGGSTASTVGAGSSFVIRSIPLGVSNQVEKQVSDTVTLYGQANQVVRNYTTAIPVSTGPARMRVYVTTLSSTSITYRASFDFIDT